MKKLGFILAMLFSSFPLSAAITGYHEGLITTLSYEAQRGIIRIDKSFTDNGCTGAYADLTDEAQRVAYSTALAAKMANQKVRLRMEIGGVDYYSNCKVFEITIMP
ncbi:hypothetical protein P886_1988 [Alteromonadaceae bacterium 2753L.S.0a.02]|nr:hypothetical protein P886_1988 [Alteromonadaceae bacterium 2753L.S.0a.02]